MQKRLFNNKLLNIIAIIIFSLALIVGLASCSSNKGEKGREKKKTEVTKEKTTSEESVDDSSANGESANEANNDNDSDKKSQKKERKKRKNEKKLRKRRIKKVKAIQVQEAQLTQRKSGCLLYIRQSRIRQLHGNRSMLITILVSVVLFLLRTQSGRRIDLILEIKNIHLRLRM